jgi:hypothetical protein
VFKNYLIKLHINGDTQAIKRRCKTDCLNIIGETLAGEAINVETQSWMDTR